MEEINDLADLKRNFACIKATIDGRLKEFEIIWKTQDAKSIYKELVFCLLTPQSKAKRCWEAVNILFDKKPFPKDASKIASLLKGYTRFHNNKAGYICSFREKFPNEKDFLAYLSGKVSERDLRDKLVKETKGLGYKEASHFLRNIGFSKELAILDRHILNNLHKFKVISEVPKSIPKATYLSIEKKMLDFAKQIKIPFNSLDLLFWYMQAGEVFK